MKELMLTNEFLLLYLFTGVFLITLFLLPRIRELSLKFKLYDTPDFRSSHTNIVPTFGGVAFYIILIFTLFYTQLIEENSTVVTLIVSITLMFFIGLKDDLQNLSAKKKFIGQIIAVAILMISSDFRVQSFYGFLDIYELSTVFSIGISIFFILGIINAYNLIDGIDGMASVIGIVIASNFGFLFFKLNMFYYLTICVAIVSALLAFLRFNLSFKKKIFMGDTGSLVLGLVFGLLTLKLLSLKTTPYHSLNISRKEMPLLVLAILIVPVFDLIRVMIIRFRRKNSIFSPDRNHIHHILIDSGLSHRKASFYSGFVNSLIVFVVFFSIRHFEILISVLILVVLILLLALVFYIMNKSYATRKTKVKVRNFLYKISIGLFYRKEVNLKKKVFNQKLKKIRILFF